MIDYYLLAAPAGVLAEEFTHDRDHTTVGLSAAAWTSGAPGWLSCASFSRALRTDPRLLARVTPTGRDGAEAAYRRLTGGVLPAEAELRSMFADHEPFATGDDDTVGAVLRELTSAVRGCGLIPVTTERFA